MSQKTNEIEKINVSPGKPKTLTDYVLQIDVLQARRFAKLEGAVREIAVEGITRHIRACRRVGMLPEVSAVREIIDDAMELRRVFAETSEDRIAAA